MKIVSISTRIIQVDKFIKTIFQRLSYRRATTSCDPILDDRGICVEEPCNALKCYKEPRVVIIGAGIAGLAAAARLVERGIKNIMILESLERPGGRLHTGWMKDTIIELGGAWEDKNCKKHPLYDVTCLEDPPRPGKPLVYPLGLHDSYTQLKEHNDLATTFDAYSIFKQIEKEADALFCLGGNKQQGSLMNFFSIRIQQELHSFPESQQYGAARIMFGLAHSIFSRSVVDTGMLTYDQILFMAMQGGVSRVPLGITRILAPWLRILPEACIRYCKTVNTVFWGTSQKCGHRATIVASDGDEYLADYVIVTVSAGVLKKNTMFCPGLNSAKVEALRCLTYLNHNKIFIDYCKPFWCWANKTIDYKYNSYHLDPVPEWVKGITSIKVVPHSKYVLCVDVKGKEATYMESLSDLHIIYDLTQMLRKITRDDCIPYPESIFRSHWTADPCFQGAYSRDCCHDGSAQRHLGCPMPGPTEPVPPIVLFAGEATCPTYNGTISGAYLSGIREAERVLHWTRVLKGPPLEYNDDGQIEHMNEFNRHFFKEAYGS